MKIEDIIALSNAGFTKEEILKVANAKPEGKPEGKPDGKPDGTPDGKPDGTPDKANDLLATVNALAETVKALQAANAGKDVFRWSKKKETADNILENLINGGMTNGNE